MTKTARTASAGEIIAPLAERIELDLQRWLVEEGTPPELAEAMRYCVLGGGKRLRPALVHLVAQAITGLPRRSHGRSRAEAEATDGQATGRAGVAIEMLHCCSLVNDDLPAMDNDVLRRGRPTAHVKFGEAMAILVGDALLTRAFGVLGECPPALAGPLAAELAAAAGAAGMVAGQVADMRLCTVPPGERGLRFIQLRKTAAMIRGAARMGAICGGAADAKKALAAMGRYGEALGLAFQGHDDLLVATADAKVLGKTPGKDARAGKRTYVTEMGLERARALADELTVRAVSAAEALGPPGEKLARLARALADRKH